MGAAAPRRTKRDAKLALAAARLPERSVELCLRGDLVAQLQDLSRQLVEVERDEKATGSASLDGGQLVELANQIRVLREEMQDDTIVLRLHALPRRKWTALVAAHPPREDNQADQVTGMNVDEFAEDLIRQCVVDPALDDEDWARLEEVLSDGQWQALTNAAFAVNTRDVDVPFSARASRILASSAHDSEPPAPGE